MYLAILWQDQLQKQAHIASNYLFHKKTKQHIEIACHFIRKKLKSRDITTRFVNACEELPKYSPSLQETKDRSYLHQAKFILLDSS